MMFGAIMSMLLSLKLTAQQKPTKLNAQLARRQKLLGRLAQQIELAGIRKQHGLSVSL